MEFKTTAPLLLLSSLLLLGCGPSASSSTSPSSNELGTSDGSSSSSSLESSSEGSSNEESESSSSSEPSADLTLEEAASFLGLVPSNARMMAYRFRKWAKKVIAEVKSDKAMAKLELALSKI